jgi:sugar lactone lactonase YvrE
LAQEEGGEAAPSEQPAPAAEAESEKSTDAGNPGEAPAASPPAEANPEKAEPEEAGPAAEAEAEGPEVGPAKQSESSEVSAVLEGVTAEVVCEGFTNPSGIAVRPGASNERAELFISDSGAYRIVRYETDKPGELADVVTEFPQSTYGKGPEYAIGPLGLEFLNRKTLLVGGGGLADGEELLRVYQIDDDKLPIKAADMKQSLGPIAKGEQSSSGEGNFYAIARNDDGVFVTANGDDEFGWVLRSSVEAGKLGELQPYIATKKATGVNAPCGAAISAKGYLVIGQMGTITEAGDSLLTFYNPYDSKAEPALNLTTKLNDIVYIAYSPATGDLYAADFSWVDPAQGGIYRIDAVVDREAGTMECKPTLVARVEKPTALAFTPDGSLWCVSFGKTDGLAEATGKLIRLVGSQDKPL